MDWDPALLVVEDRDDLDSRAERFEVQAPGWFNYLAGNRAIACSGRSEPGEEVNPAAVAAMAEVRIDIAKEFPNPWTEEIAQAAGVVVTMGCGDACPLTPASATRTGSSTTRPVWAWKQCDRFETRLNCGCASSWPRWPWPRRASGRVRKTSRNFWSDWVADWDVYQAKRCDPDHERNKWDVFRTLNRHSSRFSRS